MAISLKYLRAEFGAMLAQSSSDPVLSLARIRNALVAYERGEIRRSKCFAALSDALGGYCVETIFAPDPENGDPIHSEPLCDYVSMDDTYVRTIVYCYARDRFMVSSWGDYYESTPEYRAYSDRQYELEHGSDESEAAS